VLVSNGAVRQPEIGFFLAAVQAEDGFALLGRISRVVMASSTLMSPSMTRPRPAQIGMSTPPCIGGGLRKTGAVGDAFRLTLFAGRRKECVEAFAAPKARPQLMLRGFSDDT